MRGLRELCLVACAAAAFACDGDGNGDGDDGAETGGESGESGADEPPIPGTDGTGEPGPAGLFVAVGDGGRRASSADGASWEELIGSGVVDTSAEMGEEDILRAVAVGEGVAIAVGGGGTDWTGNAMIMRTNDGLSWEEDLVGGMAELDERKLDAIGYSEGVFIAAGHQAHILRSTDAGQTWARVYAEHPSRTTVFGVAGQGETFVLVGMHQDDWDQPKVAYVHRSTDAGQSFGAPSYFGDAGDQLVSIASSGELFVAVGPAQCLRSPAGEDWEPCGLSAGGFGAVSYLNGYFVVSYLDGVSTSTDGQAWSAHVVSPTGVPAEIVYGNGIYAGVRYYERGTSEALVDWSFVSHGAFPLRDLAFLPLE